MVFIIHVIHVCLVFHNILCVHVYKIKIYIWIDYKLVLAHVSIMNQYYIIRIHVSGYYDTIVGAFDYSYNIIWLEFP